LRRARRAEQIHSMSVVEHELPHIESVQYVRDHVLWVRFADGMEGAVDLGDGLNGPMFAPLRDPAEFAQVGVNYGALEWPNGADWAPETLRELLIAQNGFAVEWSDAAPIDGADDIGRMPEISRFFGVVIRMLANDHLPPHVRANYGEYEVTVTIRDGVVTGRFPARALRMVLEWRDLHEAELLENWDRLRAGELPREIAPLV
jgi:hypothetical protein